MDLGNVLKMQSIHKPLIIENEDYKAVQIKNTPFWKGIPFRKGRSLRSWNMFQSSLFFALFFSLEAVVKIKKQKTKKKIQLPRPALLQNSVTLPAITTEHNHCELQRLELAVPRVYSTTSSSAATSYNAASCSIANLAALRAACSTASPAMSRAYSVVSCSLQRCSTASCSNASL